MNIDGLGKFFFTESIFKTTPRSEGMSAKVSKDLDLRNVENSVLRVVTNRSFDLLYIANRMASNHSSSFNAMGSNC